MVGPIYNPNNWETKVVVLQVQNYPGYMEKKRKKKRERRKTSHISNCSHHSLSTHRTVFMIHNIHKLKIAIPRIFFQHETEVKGISKTGKYTNLLKLNTFLWRIQINLQILYYGDVDHLSRATTSERGNQRSELSSKEKPSADTSLPMLATIYTVSTCPSERS